MKYKGVLYLLARVPVHWHVGTRKTPKFGYLGKKILAVQCEIAITCLYFARPKEILKLEGHHQLNVNFNSAIFCQKRAN
jgi:hypothetical protein